MGLSDEDWMDGWIGLDASYPAPSVRPPFFAPMLCASFPCEEPEKIPSGSNRKCIIMNEIPYFGLEFQCQLPPCIFSEGVCDSYRYNGCTFMETTNRRYVNSNHEGLSY